MEKEQDKELSKASETQPLALRRSQRTARPSTCYQRTVIVLSDHPR